MSFLLSFSFAVFFGLARSVLPLLGKVMGETRIKAGVSGLPTGTFFLQTISRCTTGVFDLVLYYRKRILLTYS